MIYESAPPSHRDNRLWFKSTRPPQPDTGKIIKEANTMSKEPIYRIKIEVIGAEDEECKINDALRGGGRM